MKAVRILLVMCALLAWAHGRAEWIQIGGGTVVNTGLPVEPLGVYSYSQSLYAADEINTAGEITALAWNYRIASTTFLQNTNNIRIYLGEVQNSSFDDVNSWVSADSMQLVFNGNLTAGMFSTTLPGNGWVTIPLDTPFFYQGNGRLVIATDENQPTAGWSGDDFYCFTAAQRLSLNVISSTANPNPLSPPAGVADDDQYKRPNLKLEITPVLYMPYNPAPANNAMNVALSPTLSWQSSAQSWDVKLAVHGQALQTVATNLTAPHWTLSNPLLQYTGYDWQVTAHQDNISYTSPIWQFTTVGEVITAPQNLNGVYNGSLVRLEWQAPAQGMAVSYRVYRNQTLEDEVQSLLWLDNGVEPGHIYSYYVVAVNHLNQLSPPSNVVTVTVPADNILLEQSFESVAAFTTDIPGWINYDGDGSSVLQWDLQDYPDEGEACGWRVFAPGQAVPPITDFAPVSGSRMAVSMSAEQPPSNDWLITPALDIRSGDELSLWARSYTDDYGLERMQVLVSVTDTLISSFTAISPSPWVNVPVAWTHYSYSLSAYNNQRIYVAVRCLSWDAMALAVDDITVTRQVGVEDEHVSRSPFLLFPNPSRGSFRVSSKDGRAFDLSVYNVKGGRVLHKKHLTAYEHADGVWKPGLYLVRIQSDGTLETRKLIVTQ